MYPIVTMTYLPTESSLDRYVNAVVGGNDTRVRQTTINKRAVRSGIDARFRRCAYARNSYTPGLAVFGYLKFFTIHMVKNNDNLIIGQISEVADECLFRVWVYQCTCISISWHLKHRKNLNRGYEGKRTLSVIIFCGYS